MLTPRFSCSQDDEFVFIDINVSHIRFDSVGVQMIVENELFIFSLSPYYLRLRFPKPLSDDEERSNAHYDSKNETIKVKIPKLVKGEHFEDLDLTQKLLARAGESIEKNDTLDTKQLLQQMGVETQDEGLIREVGVELKNNLDNNESDTKKPLIQVVDESENEPEKPDLLKAAEEGDQFDWEINQTIEENTLTKIKYGFNNEYDSIIGVSLSNGNDINDLDDPEHTSAEDRIKERLKKENYKFDPEYYAADYMSTKYSDEENEYSQIRELLKWENPLIKNTEPTFTEFENNQMLNNIPKKEYLITNPKPVYYTIISLLFSYSFESRETEGDFNTESAWTIGKLTPQISSLDQQIILSDVKATNIIKAIIITGIRRALSYPLHRNYELSLKAWRDTIKLLQSGKRMVIKALLALHESFRYHEVYYVYNKVLLDDLISWIIKDPKDNDFVFKSLGVELEKHLKTLQKSEIVFEQLDDEGDVDTFLNISEIEEIAEHMYASGEQEQ